MPRRAIDSIENEIRSLSRRIDDSRQSGTDSQMLAGIERALGEIYDVLRKLTPAEQLTGYDEAIRNLGAKLDLILRSNDDPSTVRQLEDAIGALRSIVSNIASNDALARLSEDLHALSDKVDQLARSDGKRRFLCHSRATPCLADLDAGKPRTPCGQRSFGTCRRRAALADRTPRPHAGRQRQCVGVCPSRTARVLSAGTAGSFHRPHLRPPPPISARVEEGLLDIQRSLERQHANLVSLAETGRNDGASPMDPGIVDAVKRELSDIRHSQSETDRRTQDSLETVHNTLGHVVDRLAMIEGDLRAVRAAPIAAPPAAPARATVEAQEEAPRAAMPAQALCA